MVRFVRIVAAVLCFPLVWSLCRTFCDLLSTASRVSVFGVPGGAAWMFLGMAAFLAFRAFVHDPVRMYVLGHELTHALWGLAFGARVSKLKVGRYGGSVLVSKSNVWITLAPYFFPFWTMVVVVAALIARGLLWICGAGGHFPGTWAWLFAVGFTWCMHLAFTFRSVTLRQPDIQEYGKIFSWTLIIACNALVAIGGIVCTTDVAARAAASRLASNAVSSYTGAWEMLSWLVATIRAGIG